jgi:chromosome segregation ATPase
MRGHTQCQQTSQSRTSLNARCSFCTKDTAAAEAAAAKARRHAVELQQQLDDRSAGLDKDAAELDAKCAEAAAPVAAEREAAAAAVASLTAEVDELRYTLHRGPWSPHDL